MSETSSAGLIRRKPNEIAEEVLEAQQTELDNHDQPREDHHMARNQIGVGMRVLYQPTLGASGPVLPISTPPSSPDGIKTPSSLT